MFIVGRTYENRLGRYVVLAVRGDKLYVKYENDRTASLSIPIQTRILQNMGRGQNAQQGQALPSRPTRPAVAPSSSVNWTRYDLWNSAVFYRFFSEEASGRLVYMDVDEEELVTIAPDDKATKSPLKDLVQALALTLDLRGGRLLDEHFGRLDRWKHEGSPVPPPFIALLALFCLAAQRMRSDQQFNASNYYDRLAQILFGTRYSQGQRDALTSGFRRAHLLWGELEGWLRNTSGLHGLPSAQPMYRLSHVGFPISQALLRSNDRHKLSELFTEEGLASRQDLPPRDMERIMAPWVPVSPLSQAARASWKDSVARRRMAEVASLELSAWNGTSPPSPHISQSSPTRPIAIEARILSGPRPRLNWGVVFPMPPESVAATFEAFEDGRGLRIRNEDVRTIRAFQGLGDRWSEPISDVSIADFLVSRLDMVAMEDRSKCTWQPRKVLVLTWDDELKVYRTKQHLEFGRRGIVLAYENVADKVRKVLAQVDDGEMCQVPDAWGVPEDWVAFKDVRLAGIPDTGEDHDLAALVPEIWSSVEWNGGISLPGRRRWLPSRLPTVSVNSIEEVQRLIVSVHCKSVLGRVEEPPEHQPLEFVGSTAEVNLGALDLADGAYGLTVTAYRSEGDKEGEDLSRQSFEVRSSDSPLSGGPKSLSHRSDRRHWELSASSSTDGPESPTVTATGAIVQPSRGLPSMNLEPPGDIGSTEGADHEDFVGPGQGVQRTLKDMAECFRGAHYFTLSPALTISHYYRQKTSGVCVRCGLRKAFPRARSRMAWSIANPQQQFKVRESVNSDTIIPIASAPDLQAPDYDGLLEACFALGGGPWSHFELLARQSSNTPAFPHEAIQLFSSLGHIDLELNSVGTRIRQWKVAPPALVTTESEHMYLAGYRSPRLLAAIEKAVQEQGGTSIAEHSKDGPTVYRITGICQESLATAIESVNRNTSVQLHIANRPDRSIAVSLPPLRRVLTEDRTVPAPGMAAHFDVVQTSWVTGTSTASDGLYRTDSMPRTYVFRSGPTLYEVSYRTGKHLAGAYAGRSLLAYDRQNQQLVCPLGAQLPGLYERAVVLSSGLPPLTDLRQARVVYKQVPRDVASSVWAVVYGDGATKT